MPLHPGYTLTVANPNLLRNGDFAIAQRGNGPFTSATAVVNNDDTYLLDGWIFLAAAADTCDVSRVTTTGPTGARGFCRLDVETANTKFGILQILENLDSLPIIGDVGSLQFKYRRSGTSTDRVRAAILSWSSTADTVTSDVVSNWQAQGTLPTLATNWTLEGETGVLTPTTSWQTANLPNIAIDTASAANVAVFIWSDDTTTTAGDFLEIADVKLEAGPVCTPFVRVPVADEMAKCLWHYQQFGGDLVQTEIAAGLASANNQGQIPFSFYPKRAVPAVTMGSAATDWGFTNGGGALQTAATFTFTNISRASAIGIIGSGVTPFTQGQAGRLVSVNANGRIYVSAEL